jgi:hypothetical protein
MLFGPQPSMVCQYAFSAAIAVAVLDGLTGWRTDQRRANPV